MRLSPGLPLWLALFAFASTSSAGISVLGHYRLGEDDPAAVADGSAITLVNSADAHPLAVSGAATYSSEVVSNDFNNSLLSLNFPGNTFATNDIITDVTDNFGIELWVKPSIISGSRCLAYNGTTSSNGWGIFQNGNQFCVLLGGVVFFGSHPVTTNVWTHLALVRASGLATFYVNGTPVASVTNAPRIPSGRFALGGVAIPAPAEFYNGLLDEVRVFRFDPEGFSRNDLLFPPLDERQLLLIRETGLVRLAWPASNPNTVLRTSTDLNLPTWAAVPHFYSNGLFQAIGPEDSSARFYRVTECSFMPTNSILTLKTGNNPAVTLPREEAESTQDYFAYQNVQLRNSQPLVLDFSQSISDAICRTNDLTYRWEIVYDDPDISAPYLVTGITGHDTPTLHILPDSLLRTASLNYVVFTLTISRSSSEVSAVCSILATVIDSTLTMEQFNTCQNDPPNCTNPNALHP